MTNSLVFKLPVDLDGHPMSALELGANIADDVDGTTDNNVLPTGAAAGSVIRVACSQDTFINFGDNSVTAAASNYLMPAGVEYFKLAADVGYIAYLQVSTAGYISVTLMK